MFHYLTLPICALLYVSTGFCTENKPLVSYKISDDTGANFTFITPPKRVISLAPNLTELIFSAGAGSALVGVDEYSDYPDDAKHIPKVASFNRIHLEQIVKIKSDLIIAWKNGTSAVHIAQLKKLGLKVMLFDTESLTKIPKTLATFGRIFQTQTVAQKAIDIYQKTLIKITPLQNKRTKPPKVLIQIWHQPLMSLNRNNIFSQMVSFCGGVNIFANLAQPSPIINLKYVLTKNPDVILVSAKKNAHAVKFWQKWSHIEAVKNSQIHSIHPDYTNRATLRSLKALKSICKVIQAL